MLFTLIRHAKSKVDPGIPITLWGLTPDGIEQADRLAQQEVIKNLDLLYASQQTKAIETVLYLAKLSCMPMRLHEGLAEISSFTNKLHTGQEYEDNSTNYYNGSIKRINNSEKIDEALARFEAALSAIAQNNPGKQDIGIVTHGYLLSFFTAKYTDTSAIDWHHTIAMPDIAIFDWSAKEFKQLWGEL